MHSAIARVFACNRPTDTTSSQSHEMLVRQGHSSDPQPANAISGDIQPSESSCRWSLFRLPWARLLFVHGICIQRSIRVACSQSLDFSLDQRRHERMKLLYWERNPTRAQAPTSEVEIESRELSAKPMEPGADLASHHREPPPPPFRNINPGPKQQNADFSARKPFEIPYRKNEAWYPSR